MKNDLYAEKARISDSYSTLKVSSSEILSALVQEKSRSSSCHQIKNLESATIKLTTEVEN